MIAPYASLGSAMTGTVRAEDLIPAFASLLEWHTRTQRGDSQSALLTTARNWIDETEADRDDEAGSEIVEELIEALGEYAAPFCYFGAHRGDGADFGFWFDHEYFDEACRNGDCAKFDDASEVTAKAIGDASYVAIVSDHGNVSIYTPRIELDEVFAIV